MTLHWIVAPGQEGKRAADVLSQGPGVSGTLIKKVRLYGRLTCNGRDWRMIDPVRAGDELCVQYDAPEELAADVRLVPTAGIEIIWQDQDLAVVMKPPALTTHRGPFGHESGLTDKLAAAVGGSGGGLHPVGRLDRDTSGLLVLARHPHAHHRLTDGIREKDYLALVHGSPPADSGLISLPIARLADSLIERRVAVHGRTAVTVWRRLAGFTSPQSHGKELSWLAVRLLTGRTHQIRVHFSAIGCPLVGDSLYGHRGTAWDASDAALGRQALHAARLILRHPRDGQERVFTAALPDDLRPFATAEAGEALEAWYQSAVQQD
ncbi:MAG: RluA family pseudouridine synthase [Bacillota bacterium]|nr:RluA family pseudouridine synthase [Bacillota bacterium]